MICQLIGLIAMFTATSSTYLQENGISKQLVDELVTGIMRTNYGQVCFMQNLKHNEALRWQQTKT